MSALEETLALIEQLSERVGPRRPCSSAEREAAQLLVAWLDRRGVDAQLESFNGYPSGGYQAAVLLGLAFAGSVIQPRKPRLGTALIAGSLLTGAMEEDLRVRPVSRLLSRWPSQNVVATVAPRGEPRTRVCLCGHVDSTRSGLIFHPRLQSQLPALMAIPGIAMGAGLASQFVSGKGRKLLRAIARGGLGLGVALIAERELRGQDVPGANDNASGTAVALQLLAELRREPLDHTRVDLLISGCEESWMLGAAAYLDQNPALRDVTFVNFDTVGGRVPLTYVLREGTVKKFDAAPRLVGMLEEISLERPDLGLCAGEMTAGLPTDATVAMARGFDAVTLLARGEDGIPHYHWPTDIYENIEPRTVDAALETGRLLLRKLDRAAA